MNEWTTRKDKYNLLIDNPQYPTIGAIRLLFFTSLLFFYFVLAAFTF